jgi:predicted transcriptional regulator of viral defense system
MNFIEFKEKFKDFTVFSLNDIRNSEGNFRRRSLNEWQDKGYIKKVIDKYYVFSDLELNENVLFEIANRIYSPSYVSMEMALSYYHLIPESVYTITSITTKKTNSFDTKIGNFDYRTVKPEFYFGFIIEDYDDKHYKIASIEKSILDYLYLNPGVREKEDFKSLRINYDEFRSSIDPEKIYSYTSGFLQKALKKRVDAFMEYMKNA